MNAKWITPAVTAMDEHGRIDMEANGRIYDYLIENGMDGILLLGSIGEFFAIPTSGAKFESPAMQPSPPLSTLWPKNSSKPE